MINQFNIGDTVICIRTKKEHKVKVVALGTIPVSYVLDNGTQYWELELKEAPVQESCQQP